MLNLNAFYLGNTCSFLWAHKVQYCLGVFCHVESFSISHYSFIAHLSSAPCNSPQTSQITSADKKHYVSSSPNRSALVLSHSLWQNLNCSFTVCGDLDINKEVFHSDMKCIQYAQPSLHRSYRPVSRRGADNSGGPSSALFRRSGNQKYYSMQTSTQPIGKHTHKQNPNSTVLHSFSGKQCTTDCGLERQFRSSCKLC